MSTRSLRIVFAFAVICAGLFGCNRERGGEWVDVPEALVVDSAAGRL